MKKKAEFKETEIGSIPEEWSVLTIEKATESIIDYRGKTPKKTKSGIPLITAKIVKDGTILEPNEFISTDDYERWMRRGIPECGDVVITTEAPMGEVAQLDERKVALAQRLITLRGRKELLHNNFLRYALQSPVVKNELKRRESGTTVTGIKQKELRKALLPIPSYEEQIKISDILLNLDQKIELNRQMNTTLEQMAQAIFKNWFIDFEYPDENEQPYKSSGGEMVDSELGEIPAGWEVKPIGDVCKIIGGGTPKTKEPSYWEDGDIYWATPTDMTSLKSPFIFDTSRKITGKGLENSSAKLLPIGSILMTSRATLGYFAIAKVPICTNQGFISMISDEDISKYYLLNAVENKMDMIESLAGGSTYPEISKTVFKSIKIIVPPPEMMQKYETFCDSLYERIYSNDLEINSLSELRDLLLPRLMSGKIRVQN